MKRHKESGWGELTGKRGKEAKDGNGEEEEEEGCCKVIADSEQ